jgi:hypothetical protein
MANRSAEPAIGRTLKKGFRESEEATFWHVWSNA